MVVDVPFRPGLAINGREPKRLGAAPILPVERTTVMAVVSPLPGIRYTVRELGTDRIASITDQVEVVPIGIPGRQAADAVTGLST